MLVPDSECFKANVTSTYNVIEAASKLGVKKIIIASSETTYGVCFSQGDTDYHSFPLEEDYDVDPEDSYVPSVSISFPKLNAEVTRSPKSAARRPHAPLRDGSRVIFTRSACKSHTFCIPLTR
jgi:hypothetical protein